ncbi:uncharacterized protein [Nicotiana sylvestris]|uniref:uncharacterized protein n=1 Tax=Nicotiana sylvestris TaxID=4096 RepID=UPI00388C77D8
MDPLKYSFQKPMPTGKLEKWQILLNELDIVYVTQNAVKGQALTDNLAKNPVGGEYKPLQTYFPNKEVSFVGEDITEIYDGWRMFFDGAAILKEWRFTKIEFKRVLRIQNEFANVLATLSSMIQHPDKNLIDLIPVGIHNQPAYCTHVEEETYGNPWFHDIKEYLAKGEYPEHANLLRNAYSEDYPTISSKIEATSYKAVTKKVVVDFVRDRIVCRFGVLESIITNNVANLNSDLMKGMCETFKIKYKNFTAYMPQMNGTMEAANKNIKKILRKMVDNHKKWHEKLPFALLGYCTIVYTSTEATPYMLVYGTEAVISAEVEIPSLRIIQEAELSDAEWIRSRYEQLALIYRKRMNMVCHGQLY